jgi:hypothetical protein
MHFMHAEETVVTRVLPLCSILWLWLRISRCETAVVYDGRTFSSQGGRRCVSSLEFEFTQTFLSNCCHNAFRPSNATSSRSTALAYG